MIAQAVIPLLILAAVPLLPPVGRAQLVQQWKLNQNYIHLSPAVFSRGF
jgi:hypothetical protein